LYFLVSLLSILAVIGRLSELEERHEAMLKIEAGVINLQVLWGRKKGSRSNFLVEMWNILRVFCRLFDKNILAVFFITSFCRTEFWEVFFLRKFQKNQMMSFNPMKHSIAQVVIPRFCVTDIP